MKQEMPAFERRFAEVMSSPTLPMDEVLRYVREGKGKRLRPRLVFMAARLFGEVNESTWRTALFVELLHTATLVHDDVVDASDERRGQPSVNAKWDNKTAVLCGDHLLSKAMLVLSDPADNNILVEMLNTALAMSEGELMQSRRQEAEDGSQEAEDRRQEYLSIIERKTARLMKACCIGGALSVGATQEQVVAVGEFGLNYGMLFQLRDDIADNENVALAKALLPLYEEKTLGALKTLHQMSLQ